MNATKTRSRYVSLAAVLSDQNTVAKDRPLPSVFLCLWSLCTIKYPFSGSFAIAYAFYATTSSNCELYRFA